MFLQFILHKSLKKSIFGTSKQHARLLHHTAKPLLTKALNYEISLTKYQKKLLFLLSKYYPNILCEGSLLMQTKERDHLNFISLR